jgi:hypothetical protein
MNKIDLLILAGAGAIAAAAGGLWFNHTQASAVEVSHLPDGREVHTTYPEGRERGATARTVVIDPQEDADPVTQALLASVQRLREQPCSSSAKSAYLAALRAHIRNDLRKGEAARGAQSDEAMMAAMMTGMSSANQAARDAIESMAEEGYVFRKEQANAFRAAAPNLYRGPGPEDEEEPTPGGRTKACERSRGT